MDKEQDGVKIRQLAQGDDRSLADFYNGLSERSRRTFRPLGWTTTVRDCAAIVHSQVEGGAIPRDCAGEDESAQPRTKYDLVAVCDGQIVGWSFVWNLQKEPTFGLGIADAHQGRGLGSMLMDRVLADMQQLGIVQIELTVVQDNSIAWQMYGRRGFARYGEFIDETDSLAYFRMRRIP